MLSAVVAEAPRFRLFDMLIFEEFRSFMPANPEMMSSVLSVDPPSTTMTSNCSLGYYS